MKTMRIEKKLRIHDEVSEVVNLHVKEALKYNREEDGIRAVGPLYIKGQYVHEGVLKPFQEVLDMDVLAPLEKLNPHDNFHLTIASYRGEVKNHDIQLFIELQITGLKEDEENEPVEISDETPPIAPKEESVDEDVVEQTEVISEEPTDISELEDLFEGDDQVYTSYRMIVAKQDDTYERIAKRYEVDEALLRRTNRSKDISVKTLVVLPFGKQIA